MKAEEFLRSAQKIKFKILNKQAELEAYEEMRKPSGMSYDQVRVKASPSGDALEVLAIKLAEIKEEINTLLVDYNKKLSEIYSVLQQMDNDVYIGILFRYYALGQSTKQIAKEIGYSKSYVYELKNKAFYEFDKFYYVP